MEKDRVAIKDLKEKSDQIERKKQRKEIEQLRKENDLDMVPQREKGPKNVPKKIEKIDIKNEFIKNKEQI